MHGGGISTYCYFTAQMLAAAGYQVSVFTQDNSVKDFTVATSHENIQLIKFNSNRDGLHACLGYTARLSYAFAGMVKLLIEKHGKPDIIEAQDYLGIGYYLTQFKHTGYAFLKEIPILITLHSPAFVYLEYNRVSTFSYPDFWTGEMEKQTIAAADGLISPSNFLLSEIEKYLPLAGLNTAVIANPYQCGPSVVAAFKRNKIIYYGKLSPQKGSFELLAYCKQLWDDGFTLPLHIVGGTDIVYHPEQQTMGQIIKQQYHGYIQKGLLQLHGKIAPAQLGEAIRDAHLIIVPSIVDNMPYVVMEAMGLKKIVLASVQGGQQEMIEEGVTGFLFDHNKPATFAEQLQKILALDDSTVQAIGKAARQKIIDQYGFEKIKQQKIEFLKKLKIDNGAKNHFPFLHQEPVMPVADALAITGLLSVVIPFYNMGKYIEECVLSVQKSTWQHIEIIIVNDGSNDALSLEKLKFLGTQKNITIVNQPNNGLAYTRNYGAHIAQGEHLAFLDADDKVRPEYFEKAIAALQQNRNVFFAGSWVKYFENNTAVWPTFTPQPPYVLVHNMVNSSGLVYKKNAFLKGGLNDAKVGYGLEDYESVIQMLRHGFNGIVLPEILFYYRVRTGSMFRAINTNKLLYSNKYITQKHSIFYAKFAAPVINLLNANGPGYLYDNPTKEVTVQVKEGTQNIFLFKMKEAIKKNDHLKNTALLLKKFFSKA